MDDRLEGVVELPEAELGVVCGLFLEFGQDLAALAVQRLHGLVHAAVGLADGLVHPADGFPLKLDDLLLVLAEVLVGILHVLTEAVYHRADLVQAVDLFLHRSDLVVCILGEDSQTLEGRTVGLHGCLEPEEIVRV